MVGSFSLFAYLNKLDFLTFFSKVGRDHANRKPRADNAHFRADKKARPPVEPRAKAPVRDRERLNYFGAPLTSS